MADYYSILLGAIQQLDDNSSEIRAQVYASARTTLASQVASFDPPLPASEVTTQRLALESSIRRIESEAQQHSAATALRPIPNPEFRAQSDDDHALHAAIRPPSQPVDATSEEIAPADKTEAGSDYELHPVPRVDSGLASEQEAIARSPENAELVGDKKKRSSVVTAAGFLALLLFAAGGAAYFYAKKAGLTIVPHAQSGENQKTDQEADEEGAKTKDRVSIDAERERVADDARKVQTVVIPADEISKRIATEEFSELEEPDLAALPSDEAAVNLPEQEEILIASTGPLNATLFEEAVSAGAEGSSYTGSVQWQLKKDAGAGSSAGEIEIILPAIELRFDITIRRNDDQELSASHLMEILVSQEPQEARPEVSEVLAVVVKDIDVGLEDPLIGAAIRAAPGQFWIALEDNPKYIASNRKLAVDSKFLEVAMRYSDGRRGVLTFEKGEDGDKVMRMLFEPQQ